MISDPSSASVYTDFQGLAKLRAAAGQQTPGAARETARQFEALFVQMMLKSMRDASPGGGLLDSDQVGLYRDMYDRQLSLELVKGEGLGVADLLATQLGITEEGAAVRSAGAEALQLPAVPTRPADVTGPVPSQPLVPAPAPVPLVMLSSPAAPVALIDIQESVAQPAWQPGSPEEFIRDIWSHVEQGARALGVKPEVLVAQSALETGWGKKVIRRPDGHSSFNLFNIKAGRHWDGAKVTVSTLEYAGGVAGMQRASFRAYDSIGAAVSDYVDFIRNNPRYRQALEQAADPEAYLHGLKDAGYASDPEYVEKIRSILEQDSFDAHVNGLKLSGNIPIT